MVRPESLNKDVVQGTALAVHADPVAALPKDGEEGPGNTGTTRSSGGRIKPILVLMTLRMPSQIDEPAS